MNLRDLKYLVTLAEIKHFGQAAEKCFVSQPTLSMQIKKLEEELGVKLIERNRKAILLTHAGELIAEKAQLILQQTQAIKNIAQAANDPFSANLHLALIPTIGPYLLPHILPLIKKELPHVKLFLHEEKTHDALILLQQGKIDAAILALPIDDPHLQAIELYKEKFYVALPAQHELAKKAKINIADIQQENLLLLTEGHCLREQALEVCQSKAGEFAATSLETLRYMVAAGNGITLLPQLACDFKNKLVVCKPLARPEPYRRVGLIWRKESSSTICLRKLAELIKNQNKNESA